MRIDDLDAERSSAVFADQALRDLEWLGLDWDGPVYRESSGLARMQETIRTLLESGHAYACTCSRTEIQTAQTAPQQGAVESPYPGTCRDRYDSLARAKASGRNPAVRLRVAPGVVEFRDEAFGVRAHDVAAEVGDFVIARRDGAPAYQLAVVLDDAWQGVTEVVRGADLLPSTARQLLLQRRLGLTPPRWLHAPLVTDPSGRRLAKRARDLGLSELRERGVDPRAIVGWAARSLGFPAPARLTAREALVLFDLERLIREPTALSPAEIDGWR